MFRHSTPFCYILAVVLGLLARWPAHAQVWTVTNLHPAGASWSYVSRVSDGQQVGYVHFGDYLVAPSHASLWNGNADSWVDLHPVGAVASDALDVYSGQQVGRAYFAGKGFQAGLWTGSAASWVDLSPAGSSESSVSAVYDGIQVGWASFDYTDEHAGLWTGTAESWEDLSLFLPPGSWGYTSAGGIWRDGSTAYVIGTGFNLDTNREEALLWTRIVPEPSSIALLTLAIPALLIRRRVCHRL